MTHFVYVVRDLYTCGVYGVLSTEILAEKFREQLKPIETFISVREEEEDDEIE